MSFQAVLFDFDGLILDTETPDYQSWCETCQALGTDLPIAVWAQAVGAPSGTFDECAFIEEQIGRPIAREAIRQRRSARFHELVQKQSLREGVLDALDAAHAMNLRLGIASSADRAWIQGHLEQHGILQRFEAIRCLDDVRHAKPHPEVYLAAAKALRVDPARTLVFEDSPNGIRAAKRAGMTCVAVPNSITSRLDISGADLVLDSLAAMPLTAIIKALDESESARTTR